MSISIISEQEIRQLIPLDETAIAQIEKAYGWLSSETVIMPPVMQIDQRAVQGQTCVKSALVPSQPAFAAKVASIFPQNRENGLPPNSGLMVLFNSRTGIVEAILLDNGYLTQIRTAAGGAVAAKHLAPKSVSTIGLIGAGKQARLQLQALQLVRDFQHVRIWSRQRPKAEELAHTLQTTLHVTAEVVDTPQEVVQHAEVVITATSAQQPIIIGEWLHPHLHITAMGSDAPHKNELHPGVLVGADLYVCDSRSQCERLGELHHAIQAGVADQIPSVVELGDIINQRKPGRKEEDAITVCDLTGVGAQDTAIALYTWEQAKQAGVGIAIGGPDAS